MKIETYINVSNRMENINIQREKQLKRKLASKYGKEVVEEHWLKIQQQLYVLASCVDKLEGKTILDLGCGCNHSTFDSDRNRAGMTYDPWLCRALNELGVKCIGVDKGNLDGELFEHHGYTDLTLPNSLNFIPNHSANVANARLLFSSPELSERGRFYSPAEASDKLKQILLPQLERIVKPEGYFVYEE